MKRFNGHDLLGSKDSRTAAVSDSKYGILRFSMEQFLPSGDRFRKGAAFYHLGVTEREGFVDRFFAAVISEVRKCLRKPFSAEDFVGTLEETLERRQHEYGTYRAYFPTSDESPEYTLGWEFTKVISELIRQGQGSLTGLYSLIGSVSSSVLEALDLEEVFRDYKQRAAPAR